MTISRTFAFTTSALVLALGLVGCSNGVLIPVPSPSAVGSPSEQSADLSDSSIATPPRRPEFDDLVITPSGLGSLLIGEPVTNSDMVVLSPDACREESDPEAYGYAVDDPAAGRWLSTYPEVGDPYTLFSLHADTDGIVRFIQIISEELATAEGIRVGSSLADLTTAYPTLEDGESSDISSIHYVTSGNERLVFEVLRRGDLYFDVDPDTILNIRIQAADEPYLHAFAGGDGMIGGCL